MNYSPANEHPKTTGLVLGCLRKMVETTGQFSGSMLRLCSDAAPTSPFRQRPQRRDKRQWDLPGRRGAPICIHVFFLKYERLKHGEMYNINSLYSAIPTAFGLRLWLCQCGLWPLFTALNVCLCYCFMSILCPPSSESLTQNRWIFVASCFWQFPRSLRSAQIKHPPQ